MKGTSIAEATRLWTLAVPSVSAYVMALVRNTQDRDDILQDVAVAVIEDFSRYDRAQPFLPWAMGVARNHVRLHFRRAARSRLAFDETAMTALEHAFVAEAESPLAEQLEWLNECVARLDGDSKEICRLRYEDDLKPAEIGARLGIAANTAAKTLQRIRDRLRECIQRKAAAGRLS